MEESHKKARNKGKRTRKESPEKEPSGGRTGNKKLMGQTQQEQTRTPSPGEYRLWTNILARLDTGRTQRAKHTRRGRSGASEEDETTLDDPDGMEEDNQEHENERDHSDEDNDEPGHRRDENDEYQNIPK